MNSAVAPPESRSQASSMITIFLRSREKYISRVMRYMTISSTTVCRSFLDLSSSSSSTMRSAPKSMLASESKYLP